MNKISRLINDDLISEFGSGARLNASSLRGYLWHRWQVNRKEARLIIKLLFAAGLISYDGRKHIKLVQSAITTTNVATAVGTTRRSAVCKSINKE